MGLGILFQMRALRTQSLSKFSVWRLCLQHPLRQRCLQTQVRPECCLSNVLVISQTAPLEASTFLFDLRFRIESHGRQ
jgi:hypothetical protein